MREILFRGKGTHGLNAGDWIYGYYVKDFWKPSHSGHGILPIDEERGGYCEVDPKTVGQYTGLTDKNGRKIFEGDIIKYEDEIGYVVYSTGCYCVQDIHSQNKPAIDIVIHNSRNNLEVVGNIHDNPELLKGGTE